MANTDMTIDVVKTLGMDHVSTKRRRHMRMFFIGVAVFLV